MAGIMYQIKYSKSFASSLSQTITYWQHDLEFSDEQIKNYVSLISKNIHLLSDFPFISKDVSSIYHFSVSTYRITIGKKYAIFYRVDEKKKTIMIDSLFSNKQMKIEF